eukprot:3634336-Pyramimonas_sp.AAC.1
MPPPLPLFLRARKIGMLSALFSALPIDDVLVVFLEVVALRSCAGHAPRVVRHFGPYVGAGAVVRSRVHLLSQLLA